MRTRPTCTHQLLQTKSRHDRSDYSPIAGGFGRHAGIPGGVDAHLGCGLRLHRQAARMRRRGWGMAGSAPCSTRSGAAHALTLSHEGSSPSERTGESTHLPHECFCGSVRTAVATSVPVWALIASRAPMTHNDSRRLGTQADPPLMRLPNASTMSANGSTGA